MKSRTSFYKIVLLASLLAVLLGACATLPGTEIPPVTEASPPQETPVVTETPGITNPVAMMAVQQLAAALGISASEIVVVSIEEVDWPNGCLGIDYLDMACTEAIVPGFRINLQASGQIYEFRSNLDGSLLLSAAPLPMPTQNPIALMARKALATQLQISEGDITLVSIQEVEWPDGCLGIQKPEQACMTVIVPGYKILFQAQGVTYEYRSNEDGSVLAFAGVVPGSESSPALLYKVEGGIAGFCDDLTLFLDGFVQFNSCNAVTPSKTSQLTPSQLEQLKNWVANYSSFELTQADPAVADQMIVTLTFTGTGTQSAPDDVRQEMMAFAVAILGSVRAVSPVESDPLIGIATPTSEAGELEVGHPSSLAGLIYTTANGLWQIAADGTPQQLHTTQEALLSPDGHILSWDGNDLFLTTLPSGEIRNLTNTPDRIEFLPQSGGFFADKIFFTSFPSTAEGEPGFTGYLTMINPDGSGYTVLDEQNNAGLYAVSPDEHTVAYGGGATTRLYHLETGAQESFIPTDYGLSDITSLSSPSWSPNGEMLAWIVTGNFGGQQQFALAVFDLAARVGAVFHPHQLSGMGGFPPGGVWSPDGNYVALNTFDMDSGEAGVWVIPVVPLFNKRPEIYVGGSNPLWNPDGSHLVVFNHEDGNLLMLNTASWHKTLIELPDKAFVLLDWR